MDSCQEVQDLLTSYLSEKLDPAEREKVESHLSDCAECDAKRSFLQGFRSALREAHESEPYPDGVERRLRKALTRERERKVIRLPGRWASLLAAAAVFCLTVWNLIPTTAKESAESLVAHHETCWHIAPSEGRERQFKKWVERLGGSPPLPRVSSQLVPFDQRECPASEVRGGHLMYLADSTKVSLYAFPAQAFLERYPAALGEASTRGYQVLTHRQGEWVFAAVAQMDRKRLKELVDLEQMAVRMFLIAGRL